MANPFRAAAEKKAVMPNIKSQESEIPEENIKNIKDAESSETKRKDNTKENEGRITEKDRPNKNNIKKTNSNTPQKTTEQRKSEKSKKVIQNKALEELLTANKKSKGVQVSYYLDSEIVEAIDHLAETTETPKSKVINMILKNALFEK